MSRVTLTPDRGGRWLGVRLALGPDKDFRRFDPKSACARAAREKISKGCLSCAKSAFIQTRHALPHAPATCTSPPFIRHGTACVYYDAILILGAIVVGCGGGSGGRWRSQRVGLIGTRAAGCLFMRSGRYGGSIYSPDTSESQQTSTCTDTRTSVQS